MTDPITTPKEALKAALREICETIQEAEFMADPHGVQVLERALAKVRALASRIPEPVGDDVERVAWAILEEVPKDDRCVPEALDLAKRFARAALSAMRPAEGWRLVPVEPTQAMLEAADVDSMTERGVWSAMLAAAPAQGGRHD